MKKISLFILTLLLIPTTCLAITKPKVLTIDTNIAGNVITYEGTIEDGSYAVMCKLYNSMDEEVDKLSSPVDGAKFEGSFTTSEFGTYTLSCANYEGGEIKSTNVTIEEESTTYTVTFDSKTESDPLKVDVLENEKVEKPNDPVNGDLIFKGWFTEESFENEFDFNTPITKDITLYALFEEQAKAKVEFDTRCEMGLDTIEVIIGEKIEKPEDLTNGDEIFKGWFIDDTFTVEFDFNTPITKDITLYALWEEPEEELLEFIVDDESGNSVKFYDEEGHTYKLTIFDFMAYTKEEVLSIVGITSDTYDEVFNAIKDAVKDDGTLISIMDISVIDDGYYYITEGPITIKLKLTEEMKKYNTLKLIYIDENDNYKKEEPITLTIEGDYATCVLPHLSVYTLLGTNVANPYTGDSIYIWYIALAISVIGLSISGAYTLKLKKVKIK